MYGRFVAAIAVFQLLAASPALRADDDMERHADPRAGIGLEAAHEQGIPLSTENAKVGLGSFLVQTSGCNDCHTWPNFSPTGNPFARQPTKANVPAYLAGGRAFALPTGDYCSRNITPAPGTTMPAGLTRRDFMYVLRTGCDPRDAHFNDPQNCGLLQVMPWPSYQLMPARELSAIYDYLSALPNAQPGPAAQCIPDPQGIAPQ